MLAEFDMEGRQVWFPPELPSRSAYSLFVSNNIIYLPSRSNTFYIQHGSHSLNMIERYIFLAASDDLTVRTDESAQITFVSTTNQQELWTFSLPEPVQLALFPPYLPVNIELGDSIILVIYGESVATRMEAYESESGERIWGLEKHFDSMPILLGNMIVAYDFDDGLLAYDVYDGSLLGQVTLTRNSGDNAAWSTRPVWLAGYDNTIAILYRGSGELVTLQLVE
jgi:outer membrane protein assembly factor BamB